MTAEEITAFSLRLPIHLNQAIEEEAKKTGLSKNQVIVNLIAEATGEGKVTRKEFDELKTMVLEFLETKKTNKK